MIPNKLSPYQPGARTNTYGVLVLLLLLGLALRLPLLPYLGTTDHDTWKVWSYTGATHSLTDVYRLRGDNHLPLTVDNIAATLQGKVKIAKQRYRNHANYVDYPPLTPIALGIMGKVYRWFSPNFEDAPLLNAFTKIPGLVADLFTTLLIYFAARRQLGERSAVAAASLFWLNPMVILGGPLLAYLDPLYVAPLALCAILLASHKHAPAWAAFAVAVLLKPQPVLAAPVLFIAALAQRSLPRLVGYVVSGLVVALLVVLPFVIQGNLINVLANNMNNANETYLSGNNANVWWLGGYGREVHQQVARGVDFVSAAHTTTDITHMPRLIAAGLPDPKPWALGFFILFTGTVALTWWFRFGGSPEARAGFTPAIAEALALQLYGATMLLTQVHENHAYGAAALLGVAWWMSGQRGEPVNKELLAIYLALSGVVFFNLLIFYGLGQDLGEQVLPRHLLWLDSPVLLSAINLGVFGWWLVRWIRPLPIFRREAARLSGTAV